MSFVLQFCLASALLAYQTYPDCHNTPPPGRMVDVGGHRLHMQVAGRGNPTVVLEYGAGAFSFDWTLIYPKISRFSRVVAYDRGGYAWSEPGPEPRTMRQIAFELHEGLHGSHIEAPYVMVGHSLGGPIVRTFARMYPDEVAGMVLLDTTDADVVLDINGKPVRMRTLSQHRPIPEPHVGKVLPLAPSKQHSDKRAAMEAEPFDRLPDRLQQLRISARMDPVFRRANGAEFDYLPEELQILYDDQQQNTHPLRDKPLFVIAAGRESGPPQGLTPEEWTRLVDEKVAQKRGQANLSTNSKFILDKQSGHEIHLYNPDLAVRAIREVVEAARRHSRLK